MYLMNGLSETCVLSAAMWLRTPYLESLGGEKVELVKAPSRTIVERTLQKQQILHRQEDTLLPEENRFPAIFTTSIGSPTTEREVGSNFLHGGR